MAFHSPALDFLGEIWSQDPDNHLITCVEQLLAVHQKIREFLLISSAGLEHDLVREVNKLASG